ncbi:MAG TPA: SRPBCC family protein [Solirubrobacteraceae bacterium]|nr:SRPBCC family protein [Solirubrobacteraceae bacterium]
MKLEQSFEVDAPLERVWQALVDVERVAPCLPGAAVTSRNDDGTYNGTFTIKIGPTTASYTGKLEMQNVDESVHSATMHAQGSDKRGQGGATATIVSNLSPANGGTRVQVVTDYHITGRLARFGRGGMIEDISERLLREFAGRLQSSLEGGGEAAPSAPDAPSAAASAPNAAAAEAAPGAAAAAVGPAPQPDDTSGGVDEVPTEVHEVVPPPLSEAPVAETADEPAAEPPPTEVAAVAAPPAPEVDAEPGAPEEAAPPAEPEAPAEPAPPPPPPPPAAAAPPPPPPPPPPANEPLDAGPLVGSVLIDRIKENPKPLIAAAGGLLLLRILWRRR